MTNYYEILEITENANLAEIKVAYKKLAKIYHPDLNSNAAAEEKFKLVAAAYTILSNPISRSKYDNTLAQQRLAMAQAFAAAKKPYPPAYTYQKARQYQARRNTPIDKRTERLGTLYAIVIIAGVALITYLASSMYNFYQNRQKENLISTCEVFITSAESLYSNGNQKAGLLLIDSLKQFVSENNSVEQYVSLKMKQEMVEAESYFEKKAYRKAIWGILAYMQYTGEQDKDLLYNLAIAYRAVKDYQKAVFILEKLLNYDYRRMYTLSLIADIYHKNLGNNTLALKYYEMALTNIENEFKATYGHAYRLLVSEERTPYIYKKIYSAAAELYFEINQFEKARKLLEWVIFFEPKKAKGYELLVKTYQAMVRNNAACKVIIKAGKHSINLDHLKVNCNV